MDITEQQVEESMRQSMSDWKEDWFPNMVNIFGDGGGYQLAHGIKMIRDRGIDLSWFDTRWPEEMSCTKSKMTPDEFANASEETRDFWARVAALDGIILDLYSGVS